MKKTTGIMFIILAILFIVVKNKEMILEDCSENNILIEKNFESKVNYIYEKSAEDLGNEEINLISDFEKSDLKNKVKILGLYKPNIKLNTLYDYNYNVLKSCGRVSKIKVNIELHSDIYISKEAQQFKCTKNLVEIHENKHLNFELDGINNLMENVDQIVNKNLSKINEKSKDSFEKKIKNNVGNVISDLNIDLKNYVNPLHGSIDNRENYRKEFSQCPTIENEMMFNSSF